MLLIVIGLKHRMYSLCLLSTNSTITRVSTTIDKKQNDGWTNYGLHKMICVFDNAQNYHLNRSLFTKHKCFETVNITKHENNNFQ